MAEENDRKNAIRSAIGKAVRAGAAYGVLAGGAYGTYQLVASHEEAACQEPAGQPAAPGPRAWSEDPRYEAQTRFLKILYAAYDRGDARVKAFRAAVDETYAKARPELGTVLGAEMDEKVVAVEILESGAVAVTLSGVPAKDSNLSRFARTRVRYRLATAEPTMEEMVEAKMEGRVLSRGLDVRVVAWEGFDGAKNAWEPILVPADMQPTIQKAAGDEDKPDNCAYPRWNPQGIRYGFLRPRDLGRWFA
jgi:hypothetical protein